MLIRNAATQYKVATTSRAQADAARIRELLSRFPNDPEEIVRLAYAQCVAPLATASTRPACLYIRCGLAFAGARRAA